MGCARTQIRPHAVSLCSLGQPSHQQGRITFPSGFDNIVAILPHHGQIRILSGGAIPEARLRLTIDGVDMNNVTVPNTQLVGGTSMRKYALSIPITLDYAAQPVKYYDWPTDVVPLWQWSGKLPAPAMGLNWDYEWVQADGTTPYALVDPFTIEFYLLERCHECPSKALK